MPRVYKRVLGSRRYKDFTSEALEEALKKIRTGKISQRQAAYTYKIPRSTLRNKLEDKHPKNIGGQPVLTKEEEDNFVAVMLKLSDIGYPIYTLDLRMLVKNYLDRKGTTIKKFKANLPGYDWTKLFLKRHAILSEKLKRNVRRDKKIDGSVSRYFDHFEKDLAELLPRSKRSCSGGSKVETICFVEVKMEASNVEQCHENGVLCDSEELVQIKTEAQEVSVTEN